MSKLPLLDSVFHQPVRTRLAFLLRVNALTFRQLKTELDITDGNLDAHLRKLSAAGYLHTRMGFEVRPYTEYKLSQSGVKAFDRYVRDLKTLLKRVR